MQPRRCRIHSDGLDTVAHESGELLLELASCRAGGKPSRPQHRGGCGNLFLADGGTEARYRSRRGPRPSGERFRYASRPVLRPRWGTMKILHGFISLGRRTVHRGSDAIDIHQLVLPTGDLEIAEALGSAFLQIENVAIGRQRIVADLV